MGQPDAHGRTLVLGATGDQGLPQVMALATAGRPVRAAVRDLARTATRFDGAVERALVDYGAPGSIAAACRGVDVILANFPSSSFNDGTALLAAAAAVGRAAREAGVRRIVFNTSLPQRDRLLGYRAHDVRFAMREALAAPGVPVVTLCPVVFMDNLLRGWAFPHIADDHCFVYPHAPQLEVSWICQADLAALMIAAATRPGIEGRVIPVGGPDVLRGAEVAAILSAASGRDIRFVSQSVEEFAGVMRALMKGANTTERDAMINELARIYHWYNESAERPFRVDMAAVVNEFGVALTPMRVWAAQQNWSR